MEGDMKDIVLARLEKRLKEKDEELRSLRSQAREGQPEDLKARVEELEKKVDHLEQEVVEAQVTMSEVMKKVGVIESLVNGMMIATVPEDEEVEEIADQDLMLDGQSMPQDMVLYNKYIAAKTDPVSLMKETEESSEDSNGKNGLRFFRLNKSS